MIIIKNISKAILPFLFLVLFTKCDPYEIPFEKFASVAVTHASPGTPTVDILVDGKITTSSRLIYNRTTISAGNSIYLPVFSGSRSITVSPDTSKTNYVQLTNDYPVGNIRSIYVYDTLLNGNTRSMMLNDDLTLPTGTNAKVRFLHLAPLQGAVDVTFLRTNASPLDSVTIANMAYAGATPNTSQLEKFISLPGGSYTIKLKTAGTQTVLLSTTTSTMLTAGRITTVYATGTAKSQPLVINTINNFGSL